MATDNRTEKQRGDDCAAFLERANEDIARISRMGTEFFSDFYPVDGVTVPARIWHAVEVELGATFSELFRHDRPALFALLREKWRAQRQAEEQPITKVPYFHA